MLEVAGPGGARAFSVAQLKKLPATAGFGGVKSSTGKVTLPGGWKGVALRDLVAAAGGCDATKNLTVTAKDGYSITFSHDQAMNGGFAAYDPGAGDTLASHEPLTAIVACEHEGRPLNTAQDGPLRVMVVSAAGSQVTDGHWSIKWVTKLAINPAGEAWSLSLEGARPGPEGRRAARWDRPDRPARVRGEAGALRAGASVAPRQHRVTIRMSAGSTES